jgi:hypothetical protein
LIEDLKNILFNVINVMKQRRDNRFDSTLNLSFQFF